jgi:hypothetical protein
MPKLHEAPSQLLTQNLSSGSASKTVTLFF